MTAFVPTSELTTDELCRLAKRRAPVRLLDGTVAKLMFWEPGPENRCRVIYHAPRCRTIKKTDIKTINRLWLNKY